MADKDFTVDADLASKAHTRKVALQVFLLSTSPADPLRPEIEAEIAVLDKAKVGDSLNTDDAKAVRASAKRAV